MEFERLETEQISGVYDATSELVRVTYRGVLTPDVTKAVYAWLGKLIAQAGGTTGAARGSIYDFRDVVEFDSHNLTSAQRQSSSLKSNMDREDIRNHPVALVVGSKKQEQYVKLNMMVVGVEKRQRIVYSIEEAEAFIEDFLRALATPNLTDQIHKD